MSPSIHIDSRRRHTLGKPDTFFQRFLHFLMVQCIRRAICQALAVGNGCPSPRLQQINDARSASFLFGSLTLCTNCTCMREKYISNLFFFRIPYVTDSRFSLHSRQNFIALQKLFHLYRIVSQCLGSRINSRQTAANHHHRQAQLHIGDGITLCSAG